MNAPARQVTEYLNPSRRFANLSLRDLIEARDRYHADLMQHPNVVGTAVGRYRIRKSDSWPTHRGAGKHHGTGVRTLENSEVRAYSWPAILVFVKQWESLSVLARSSKGPVPKTLYLNDERDVPVCVIEAPKESETEINAPDVAFPINNIGGGNPVIAQVQGRQYAATIACLASDGHKVYALTNRHVTGDPGEIVYARLGGKLERIGISSEKQLTRKSFMDLYPGLPGQGIFVNLDVGLIEIDNLERWTATIGDRGEILGPMIDLAVSNYLSLIGCPVRGFGGASGESFGEVHALFYRYKTSGGFEYIADLLIGPRNDSRQTPQKPFSTLPGDSGTLWVLDPPPDADGGSNAVGPLPLAIQWGRNMLYSAGAARPQGYVLATTLSKVCCELEVDLIRNWNLDQDDTWGALGHFTIAAKTQNALSNRFPLLNRLMDNNALIVGHDDADLRDGKFTGLGTSDFVPLADVPDFFWKQRIAKQGFARPMEGPNHFADMDQPDKHGKTLLSLCKSDPDFIDPDKWNDFYDSVTDLMDGTPIKQQHRGLLPFRVWQIFDEMVRFAGDGDGARFVCAAGVLTHYIGDACQPLHISYLHDGDPLRKYEYTFSKGKKAGESEWRPLGNGVHSAYEDAMIFANRVDIIKGVSTAPQAKASEQVASGKEAARKTVELMSATFTKVPPADIVEAYIKFDGKPKEKVEHLWKTFGTDTIHVMKEGAHLLAVLWESAWALGDGETNVKSSSALTHKRAMDICGERDFLPSLSIHDIGATLQK